MQSKTKTVSTLLVLLFIVTVPFGYPAACLSETEPDAIEKYATQARGAHDLASQSRFAEASRIVDLLLDMPRKQQSDEALLELAEVCTLISDSACEGSSERTKYFDAAVDIVDSVWQSRESNSAKTLPPGGFNAATAEKLLPFIVNTGNHGTLSSDGKVSSTPEQVTRIFEHANELQSGWIADGKTKTRDIVIYAHGGLVSERRGLKSANKHLGLWLENCVYPINIVWQSGANETLAYLRSDRRASSTPESGSAGFATFSVTKGKVLLAPKLVEAAARKKIFPIWKKMKENARAISSADNASGAGQILIRHLQKYYKSNSGVRIHLVGHSAGSIVVTSLLKLFGEAEIPVTSITFLAPAIRLDEFKELVTTRFESVHVKRLTIFNLDDRLEREDLTGVIGVAYKGSLLYLVSRALEQGSAQEKEVPILGMSKFLTPAGGNLIFLDNCRVPGQLVVSNFEGTEPLSRARQHGAFDDDQPTLNSVVRIIKGDVRDSAGGLR